MKTLHPGFATLFAGMLSVLSCPFALAATLTVGDLTMDGNTLSIPVTVAGGGEVSLHFAAAEPKDGTPVPPALAVATKTAADGETVTFQQQVVLGKKVAYRLVVDGDEKSGTYEAKDTVRYQWKNAESGLWSDSYRWKYESGPKDGLERLGYPSYGSGFVFKDLPDATVTVKIDAAYTGLAKSRFGRDNEHTDLTLKAVATNASVEPSELEDSIKVGNSLTLDGVRLGRLGTFVVRDNVTFTLKNGAYFETSWEFRVEKKNAKLVVASGSELRVSVAEPYHRLGLAADGAEIVIDDALINTCHLQICSSGSNLQNSSPKGITFKGASPQLQIRGYAKNYQPEGATPPTLTFVIPEDGFARPPILKDGNESGHKFIDLDSAAQKIGFAIDPDSPFLARSEYKAQTLVDWNYHGNPYRIATDNFTIGSDLVSFGPDDLTHKSLILCTIGTKQPEPGVVAVSFDANGGQLEDDFRLVRTGGTYGENVNLYTASAASDFIALGGPIEDHVFTYSTADRWWNFWSRKGENIRVGRNYTYVVEVLSYENESPTAPWFNVGQTGGDQPSQLNWASFQASGTGVYTATVTGRSNMDCTTLGRDYVDFNHDDGGVCKMTFRVSLFAGKDAVAENFEYVSPGEGAACPLPVPTRTGFEFAGWVDAKGQAVTDATVVTAMGGEDHTLKATWHRRPGTVIPVRVFFDGNGGQAGETFRIVNTEEPFGRNVNLYTAEITQRGNAITDITDGVFTYASAGQWCNYWSKPIDLIDPGRAYTYVLEILSYSSETGTLPEFHIGWTDGDTYQSAQLNSAPNIRPTGVGRYFSTMTGRTADIYRVLERAYVYDPGTCEMTFRVSLFAGTAVTSENFGYVAPGAGMALPLPTATCRGKIFDRWVDEAGNTVTDKTTVQSDGDITLKAMWKPWDALVANGDRPEVGKTMTLSTTYGDGSREGEDGVVSFRWYRGDWKGDYEATPIAEGASYTPAEGDLEHFLKGVVVVDGVELLENAIWLSKLPVVYIDTADGADIVVKTDEKDATVRIQGNAEFKQQYAGAASVKGRGNSTWGMPKKPYKMKLDKKTDLFGFGKNKHWVLLANYIDVSSMRNKTAYDMSGEFGLTYQASTWVQVVFNGRFDGTYQLGEHIRVGSDRVDVFDWEDYSEKQGHTAEDFSWIDRDASVDVTGGYLWELSSEYDEISKFKIDVKGDGETDEDIPLMFNKPEYACTSTRMMNWSKAFWQDVYASWTTRRNESVSGASWVDLCDLDSMVSYWLVNEIFGNDDAWYKSRYCHKDVGGKLTFGPVWDFDWGCGSVVVGTDKVTSWRLAKNNNSGWPVSFYKQWLNDPAFCMKAREKYWQMRPKFTALLKDGGDYDRSVAYLREAGLVEDARWNAERTSSYGANKRTQAQDAAMFKEWMTTRLAWLDTVFATLDGFIAEVQNGESANKYAKHDDKLVIEPVGRYSAAANEYRVMQNRDLVLKVTIKCSAKKVDVMVNGRFIGQANVTKYGASSGTVDEVVIPNADWFVEGQRTLVELVTRDADSGAEKYSNHVVVKPFKEFVLFVR